MGRAKRRNFAVFRFHLFDEFLVEALNRSERYAVSVLQADGLVITTEATKRSVKILGHGAKVLQMPVHAVFGLPLKNGHREQPLEHVFAVELFHVRFDVAVTCADPSAAGR